MRQRGAGDGDVLSSDTGKESVDGGLQTSEYMGEKNTGFSIKEVKISFDYTRMSTMASNQIAAWVQDQDGGVIKTIYVSDFTGTRRGYESREDALNHWVAAADPASLTDQEIDAVSGATVRIGRQSFLWDMTDDNGRTVQAGKYIIFLEGTLFWSSNVVYSSEIDLAKGSPGELEISMVRSEPDNHDNETMIQNVKMMATASE